MFDLDSFDKNNGKKLIQKLLINVWVEKRKLIWQ